MESGTREVRVGNLTLKVGERLKEMVDSTDTLSDPSAIRKRLTEDGYVLLRGVLDKKKVMDARRVVVSALDKEWNVIDTKNGDIMEARTLNDSKGFLLTGYRPITHHKDVLSVLESRELVHLFESIFKGAPTTFNNKWVRVQSKGQFTDEHSDFFRFCHCAHDLHVCWIPLGNYTPLEGTLAVCSGSHKLAGYKEKADMKCELPDGFDKFSKDAVWRTSKFNVGDILIFDVRVVHASTMNTTERFRISMDTRWQPAKAQEGDHFGFRVFKKSDSANG